MKKAELKCGTVNSGGNLELRDVYEADLKRGWLFLFGSFAFLYILLQKIRFLLRKKFGILFSSIFSTDVLMGGNKNFKR